MNNAFKPGALVRYTPTEPTGQSYVAIIVDETPGGFSLYTFHNPLFPVKSSSDAHPCHAQYSPYGEPGTFRGLEEPVAVRDTPPAAPSVLPPAPDLDGNPDTDGTEAASGNSSEQAN